MNGGWTPESWDPAPWDPAGWVDDLTPGRDPWTGPYGPINDGPGRPVLVLAAGGGAVAATALGLVVLLLGGAVVALIVGAMVLLGACAVGSAYLRGAR